MSKRLWLPHRQNAEKYYGAQGETAERHNHFGYLTLPVLEFLWGQQWDDLALACVMTLRPSTIRVTAGECTTDSCCWRVTVYQDDPEDRNFISRIDQEVEIPIYDSELRNGADMIGALRKLGLDLNRYLRIGSD